MGSPNPETIAAFADWMVEPEGDSNHDALGNEAATARLSFESRLGLEAFAIPERQRDAVAKGIK